MKVNDVRCNKTGPKYTYHCLSKPLMVHMCGCWFLKYWRHREACYEDVINLAHAKNYSFSVIWKPKQYHCPYWQHYYSILQSRFLCRFGHVRTHSNGFSKIHASLNPEPNMTFGSSCSLNFELNFSQVQRSSGSNRGSEPNYGSTNYNNQVLRAMRQG
jgi:hypothetical protein